MTFYGSPQRNKGSMLLPANAGSGLSLILPATKSTIKLQEVQIPSEKVWSSIYKTPYNGRNLELLSAGTVWNMLRSIRSDGRNTVPVIAVKHDDGRYEVLSGIKRSYAVSISPGCNLVIHYALSSELSEADKAALAGTYDKHEKPSFLDVALSIRDFQSKRDTPATVRELSELFDVSKSSVSDLQRINKLPTELFNLYPSASHVGRNFLFSVVQLNLSNETIIERLEGIAPVRFDVDMLGDEEAASKINEAVAKLNSEVLFKLKPLKPKRNDVKMSFKESSPFFSKVLIDGVAVKPASKGGVVLELDKKFLESELVQQLIKVITKEAN